VERWKGFALDDLKPFGYRQGQHGVELPYLTREGRVYRWKLFPSNKQYKARWVGDSKPQIPYGLETLTSAEGDAPLILTEGESDAIALRLAFPKLPILGIPGASSWKDEWTPILEDFRVVYLSFDADAAGDSLAASLRMSRPDARTIRLPDGADTRDVLQRLGRKSYVALIEEVKAKAAWKEAIGDLSRAENARRSVEEAWVKVTAS
jgi:DNA primase